VQHQSQGWRPCAPKWALHGRGGAQFCAIMVVLLLGVSIGAYLLINSIRRALAQAKGGRADCGGDLRSQWEVQRHDEFGSCCCRCRP
jgi:hypothetical protein